MAVPVAANVDSSSCPSSGSAATITLSCGSPSAGDLLVAFLASGSGSGRKINVPGDWSSAMDQSITISGVVNVQVMYKVATGAETTQAFTAAASFGRMAGALLKITGAIDPATTAFGTATPTLQTGGSYTFPDATAPADESLCVSFSGGEVVDGGEATTPPSGETEIVEITTDQAMSLSTFSASAGSVGTRSGSYTPTWRSRFATTVCIAPVAAASGQPAGKRMGGVQFGNRIKGVW